MTKLKNPLLSLGAIGRLAKDLVYTRRRKVDILEKKPVPYDAKSLAQLSWRHMYLKAVALWHALSAAEKQEWNSLAGPKHMTGYAYFISLALKPNPGLYLPLQGGTMQGIIDMNGYEIEALPDPIDPQDADTKAARDAAIAAAIGGSLHCDIYGFDGSIWQKLLVESAAYHNLRVRLYAGANAIDSHTGTGNILGTASRLATSSCIALRYGGQYVMMTSNIPDTDAEPTNMLCMPVSSFSLGFDGANWDRLRVYPTGILKVGRASIGLLDIRKTAIGQVGAAGTRKLFWMTMNPTAANSVIELTDDTDGSTAIKWDMTHGVNAAHHMNLDPPLEFSNGIFLKTLTNFTSVIFGYK